MNNTTSHLWTNRPFQPTYEGFGSLRFGFHWAKFPIRILAEWDSCSLNNYYEIMTNFILLDAQDIQYLAVIDFAERERIHPLLCIGLLYCISNFRIVPAPDVAKPIDTDMIIVLSKLTIIDDLLRACGISRFKFNFCSWETFGSRIGATEISDACGVLKTVGNIEYRTNDIERLDLTLITSSMEEVHVSLWGIKTALFEMNFACHRHKNVVVIITALSPRQRRGSSVAESMYLSSTRATTISFDLKYKDLANLGQQVAEQYGEFICSVPLETHLGNLLNPAATPPTSTLGEILETKLWVHQRVI
ncbi:hypothetical protein POM88_023081 [Heracleum sosnowskyi]|uniref:Uncharacterized protein n=1 Tax=Heracleum sosnowskyi TaxID=360622 RepID=A0AAD8II26_9APIA|nr:hypothetical protein POM88_023081 [Heracleum sosnowskyi]